MKLRTYPVSRVQLSLPQGGFQPAITEAVKWIAKRSGSVIPNEAFAGEPFDTGLDAHAPAVAHAIAVDGTDYWAAKLRFPDSTVPGRLWLTEIVIRDGEQPEFCARLGLKDNEDSLKSNATRRSVPGIARQIVDSIGATDGRLTVDSNLVHIETLEEFNEKIVDSGRRLPFLLFGSDAFDERGGDITKLAAELTGVIHIGVISPDASWAVTQNWTRRFSVFGSFAKLYFPILNPAYIEPLAHPLINLESLQLDRFRSDIIGACQKYRHPAQADLPRFLDISARLAENAAVVSDPADQAQINELQSIIAQQREEIASFEETLDEAAESDRKKDKRIADLEQRFEDVEARLKLVSDFLRSLPDRAVPPEPPPLKSVDLIAEWCELAGAGHLELSKEFLKTFEDAPDDSYYLYRVGLALHGIARLTTGALPMTGRNLPIGQGVEVCPIGDTNGFDYSFSNDGKRYRSDWHAKWGNDWDIRNAFRIYYFWDKSRKKAVLHCFGTHLDSRLTN